MRRAVALGFGFGIGAAVAGGCAVLAGIDDERVVGHDAGTEASADAADAGCARDEVPARPMGAKPGGVLEFVVAVRSIDFGEASDAGVGLDLDGFCTCCACKDDGPSCKNPVWFAPDAGPRCDGTSGHDNAAAELMRTLASGLGQDSFGSDYFSKLADTGAWSLLFRVKGYNGEPDDEQVQLAIFPTTGFTETRVAPVWDGSDRWAIPRSALGNGVDGGPDLAAPEYVDSNAYVSGGTLVAAVPSTEALFGHVETQFRVELTRGILRARVTRNADGVWTMTDGLLVARWKLEDVFRAISTFRDPKGHPYCKGDFGYAFAKNKLCSLPDIGVTDGDDLRCDSLSIGMAFEAAPAKLGDVVPPPMPPGDACAPSEDPANDSCP